MKLTDKELKQLRKAEKAYYNAITRGQLSAITKAWDDEPTPQDNGEQETQVLDHNGMRQHE